MKINNINNTSHKNCTQSTMKLACKPLLLALLATGSVGLSLPANASSDWGCGSNFSLDNRTYNQCQVNFPTLDTGNDTQTNLYLLLADKGLIDFEIPQAIDDGSRYHDYPLNLRDLQETAVNQVKNPRQSFLEYRQKNWFAEYCTSFNTGISELKTALQSDPNLTSNERQQLLQFRQHIENNCHNSRGEDEPLADGTLELPTKWSEHAQPYADYIVATQLFYSGDKASFDKAYSLYTGLTQIKAGNRSQGNEGLNWLVDTANYMLIRTAINRIYQHGIGDYIYKKENVDPRLFASAQRAITTYLKHFENGRYITSARGLQRRLYWLAGEQDKLVKEIEWQINHPKSPLFNLDSRVLPAEIERKVFFPDYEPTVDIDQLNDPILLTTFALYRIRPARGDRKDTSLTLAELKQLKPKFVDHTDLYQYLLATYYFVQQDNPRQALQYLPTDDPTGKLSYTNFSQYVLKAKALEALGQHNDANVLWHRLHQLPKQAYQDTITELALTLQAERSNDYSEIFNTNADAKASVQSQALKMRVIRFSADPKLLQKIADSHSATDEIGAEARYALLTKSLMNGQYADFLRYQQQYLPKNAQDYQGYDSDNKALQYLPMFSEFNWQGKKISRAINCQDLTTTVTRLRQNPQDRLQNICLSEFIYDTNVNHYLEDYYKGYYTADDSNTGYRSPYLGNIPSRFAGQPLNRLDIYQSVFAGNKKDELSAYALHRAIGCFASSGNNHCSDENVEASVRKAWFRRLKSDYSHTSWAKNQKYYW